MWSVTVFIIAEVVIEAFGHGRLMDPPGRSSAWRFGYNTPKNYDDHALNCGGLASQQSAGGRCGICGDPYTGTRKNEANGIYATGLIVRNYTMDQVIRTRAEITANHFGWMEYRICPNNNYRKEVTQKCLDQNVLLRADGQGTKVDVLASTIGYIDMDFQLPHGMVCSQCVIQWKYHAGNSWGVDKDTGRRCIGCGVQEEFYGCADVSITAGSSVYVPDLPTTIKPFDVASTTSSSAVPTTSSSAVPTTSSSAVSKTTCYAINEMAGNVVFNKWCADNCPTGDCPSNICACPKCHAIGPFVGKAEIDQWCVQQCATDVCPPATCACPVTAHHPVVTTPTTVMTTASPTTTTTVTTPSTTTTITTPTTESTTKVMGSTRTMDTTPTVEYIQYQTVCKAVNMWEGNDYLNRWCADSCARDNCPADSCQCNSVKVNSAVSTTTLHPVSQTLKECKALSLWQGIDTFDKWCTELCNTNECPEDMCACTVISVPTMLQTTQHQMQSSTAARKCASKQGSSGEFDWDKWCQNNCDMGTCKASYCLCDL